MNCLTRGEKKLVQRDVTIGERGYFVCPEERNKAITRQ